MFRELPAAVQQTAARSISLAASYPKMYPVRRRGVMEGYRYFRAKDYLFYYSSAGEELRIAAIIPGRMERA